MDFLRELSAKTFIRITISFCLMLTLAISVVGCSNESVGVKTLPEEEPEAVVKAFYGHIAEGGPMAIGESFKMIDAEKSKLTENRFRVIAKRYPPGFKIDIIESEIKGTHAEVVIEYKMASMFGGEFTSSTAIPLNVDETSNTWKIDFTGESDDQDIATIRKDCDAC
jgi:hypothetical protein